MMTFLHNENYGSILQAWALQETLRSMGFDAEHIDYKPSKQEKLRKTAAFYLSQQELDCPVRFDVAEVYTDEQHSMASVRIEYLENAF